jgi:hypothetical protein
VSPTRRLAGEGPHIFSIQGLPTIGCGFFIDGNALRVVSVPGVGCAGGGIFNVFVFYTGKRLGV